MSARGPRRLPALGGLLALAVAALAGCASVPSNPGWSPPAPEATRASVLEPDDPALGVQAVSAAAVPSLTPQQIYTADPALPIAARWAYLPGGHPWNGVLDGLVADAVAQAAGANGIAYRPVAAAPPAGGSDRSCRPGSTTEEASALLADPDDAVPPGAGATSLVVACEVVLAAGSHLGQRVRVIVSVDGAVVSDESTTYLTDTAGSFVATPAELYADGGATTLYADVVSALKRRAGALDDRARREAVPIDDAAARELLADVSFAPDGALIVRVPAAFSSPELAGFPAAPALPVTVRVEPAAAAEILDERGRAIQSSVASGAPFEPPASVPMGLDHVRCDLVACVAVTYDDGPSPAHTPPILDALAERHAAATFYMLGTRASQNPALVARVAAEGHDIGNHTWNHPSLPSLSAAQVRTQLADAAAAIAAGGGGVPATFRPPYGEIDGEVLAAAGLPAVLWDVDTRDWSGPPDDAIVSVAVDQARPGSIVLLHDVHDRTARVTPAVIDGLQARGFSLVTLDQLFLGDLPAGGTQVRHA